MIKFWLINFHKLFFTTRLWYWKSISFKRLEKEENGQPQNEIQEVLNALNWHRCRSLNDINYILSMSGSTSWTKHWFIMFMSIVHVQCHAMRIAIARTLNNRKYFHWVLFGKSHSLFPISMFYIGKLFFKI